MPLPEPCVLAGVFPGQSAAVVREAAGLAAALGQPLVCAYVNPARYLVSEAADGMVISSPVDPDFMDDAGDRFPAQLAASLERELAGCPLAWRMLLLAGDPAQALGRCANTLGAGLIVVGTHGDSHTPLREILNHSVATRLSRTQRLPVLVVPTHHERAGTLGRDGDGPGRL